MDAKPTLYYFSGFYSRGDPIKMALWKTGMEYNFNGITLEEWGNIKSDKSRFPLGSVPVWQHSDGSLLVQTPAILGYVGDICHLHPKDPLLKAKADSLMLTVFGDVVDRMPAVIFSDAED